MKNKRLFMLSLIVVVSMILAACGNKENDQNNIPVPPGYDANPLGVIVNTPVPITDYHFVAEVKPGCSVVLPEKGYIFMVEGWWDDIVIETRDQQNNQIWMDILDDGEHKQYENYVYEKVGQKINLYTVAETSNTYTPICVGD